MLERIEMIKVKQIFQDDKVKNIEEKVEQEIRNTIDLSALAPGAEIAITAGSRGIANIVEILCGSVNVLTKLGYSPFIIPAMGSHGGATAEGQVEVLEHLGINEESVGAEIRSSMKVELIAHTKKGVPVYMDKHAYDADGIIVINRVKAHTAFRGDIESGLSKMVTIGLGKIRGASFVHANGALKMAENIKDVCESALHASNILMGIALVENGYDETAEIVGVSKEEWFEKEATLLIQAKKLMPRLPIDEIDLLIVDEMGKTFSGTGMDPNIIGRWKIEGVQEPKTPNIKRLAVLNIAKQSFGNAQGIGLADFTTEYLVEQIDRKATYTNAITSTYLQRAMLPFIYKTEKESIEEAIKSIGPEVHSDKIKLIQIPNTLHLDTLIVSEPVIQEMNKLGLKYERKETIDFIFNEEGILINKITKR